jgi:hypothetical protein
MTQNEVNRAILTKRLPLNIDFWMCLIFSSLIFGGGLYGVGVIILDKFGYSDIIKIPFFILVFGFILWRYWQNNKLEIIENEFTRSTNFTKTRKSLKKLGWKHWSYQNAICVDTNHFYLRFLEIKIIPTQNAILYNFQYVEYRGIRMPFFFGIRTYAQMKFEKSLSK